ncbi:glycosyltransferase [Epilithonimonas sp.]|uniref:glycosyltransferase family 2 protein n=1 Tax=Epilithonimonas sp. TaxID=2894511 RepID=UPI002897BF64|nr:glycosyltransferase [Epilithonimonas sp.]
MNNLSFLVGLKNNLEYSQKFYENTRLFYPNIEIVFVSFGSSDGTHEWLDSLEDTNLKYYYSEENRTLSDTYNKAIEISTKEFICFLHNDMVLGENFGIEILKSLENHPIVYYKTVEPPIFDKDERLWKEVRDFGDSFENFDHKAFYDYEKRHENIKGEFSDNVSFFLASNKNIIKSIGGLDPLFSPMFCEDDDLILRLKLSGEKFYVCPNAITYHFVSKTSRFSEEYRSKTKLIEENSQRNFARKWGFYNFSKSKAKYDIGIVLKNTNLEILSKLEPLASTIYVDIDFTEYLASEQPRTSISLKEKIKNINDFPKSNDVLVYINGSKLNSKSWDILNNISDVISQRISEKKFKSSALKRFYQRIFKGYKPMIIINRVKRLEKKLIKRN